ncbi:HIT family protein [Plantibacter elymi (nom. nud.)]
MCADAHFLANEHSALIATTDTSYVRLARNQHHAGYSLVILREHVVDMVELPPDQLSKFWKDAQRAACVIDAVFRSKKIHYLVMGHRMPPPSLSPTTSARGRRPSPQREHRGGPDISFIWRIRLRDLRRTTSARSLSPEMTRTGQRNYPRDAGRGLRAGSSDAHVLRPREGRGTLPFPSKWSGCGYIAPEGRVGHRKSITPEQYLALDLGLLR